MPVYDAMCQECGAHLEYVRSFEQCMDTPVCCGVPAKKVILTAPMGFVMGTFQAFRSPVDGSLISTTRELNEHNKRNGVVSLADGYSEEAVKSGAIAPPKQKSDIKDLKQDIAEATSMVKQGYKPEVQYED